MDMTLDKVIFEGTEIKTNRDGGMPKQLAKLIYNGGEWVVPAWVLLPRNRKGTPYPPGDYLPTFRAYVDTQWNELKGAISDYKPLAPRASQPTPAKTGTGG